MTASFADHELWHVRVASDDVKRMNVDQLDDAFRLDIVDASTLVWKAGMTGWERLGAIAGLDAPEPPRAPPAPVARSYPRPPSPRPAAPVAVDPFAATALGGVPQFVRPVAVQLPARRAMLSSVDFRRRPGSTRWGRWLIGALLLGSLVLVAYRQRLLQDGARNFGVEGKYLALERTLQARIDAKAPPGVKNALNVLGLRAPSGAALADSVPRSHEAAPPKASAAPAAAPPVAETPAPSARATDAGPAPVSIDSLPVEATADVQEASLSAPGGAPKTLKLTAKASVLASTPKAPARPKRATKPARSVKPTKPAAASHASSAEREAPAPQRTKLPPPSANDSPLKAAIRSAIAADG